MINHLIQIALITTILTKLNSETHIKILKTIVLTIKLKLNESNLQ